MKIKRHALMKLVLLLLFVSWMSQSAAHIHGIDLDHDAQCELGYLLSQSDHLNLTQSAASFDIQSSYEVLSQSYDAPFIVQTTSIQERAPPFTVS